jgi:hypothetical protein
MSFIIRVVSKPKQWLLVSQYRKWVARDVCGLCVEISSSYYKQYCDFENCNTFTNEHLSIQVVVFATANQHASFTTEVSKQNTKKLLMWRCGICETFVQSAWPERNVSPKRVQSAWLERNVSPKRVQSAWLEINVSPKRVQSAWLEINVSPKRVRSAWLERNVSPKRVLYESLVGLHVHLYNIK